MNWYLKEKDQTLKELGSAYNGLSSNEACKRLDEYGPNKLVEENKRSPLLMIFEQFKDVLIIILLAAALVAGIVGDPIEALAILTIVILNAVIGFVQEFRAEKALEALRKMAAPAATVVRNTVPTNVPSSELVPGDVVLLETGRIVPADMRLIESGNLKADESALTGESIPVEKHTLVLNDEKLHLGDRTNMVYSGTVITYGRGEGVVTATGMKTELGKIAHLLEGEKKTITPLQMRLESFSKRLALAILAIVTIIFAVGLARGEQLVLMFLTSVSLAVAAIPEALPAVITISLAFGAKKLVKQNALIRNLPAVETLGSVTSICSDKTGTLTLNKMNVEKVWCSGKSLSRVQQFKNKTESPSLKMLMHAMALNNDAFTDNDGTVGGDPTEAALYTLAKNSGHLKENLEREFPRVAEIPFDSGRKLMTTFHKLTDGRVVSFTKGAVESLTSKEPLVDYSTRIAANNSDEIHTITNKMAEDGLRVLGFAMREWDSLPGDLSSEIIETDLIFLGLAGMMDPPRTEAEDAVKLCKAAGIKPIMITGDHPVTAQAIAKRLGISDGSETAITGRELAEIPFEEFEKQVKNLSVYARVEPEQKLKIVTSLQDKNQFVAMTGDGVNDAPALKKANIGIAMGITGTDVSKQASDIILLDDNFATIVKAVKEGRQIYDNILKFINYSLTSNAGTIWVVLLAPFFGLPLPLLPIQILWMNLLCDSLPGLALTAESANTNVMKRAPRPFNEGIFSQGRGAFILKFGFIIGITMLVLQTVAIRFSMPWQTMLFSALVFGRLAVAMAVRSENESLFRLGLLSNKPLAGAILLTLALHLAVVYSPSLNQIFMTEPLSLKELAISLCLAAVVLPLTELEKLFKRNKDIKAGMKICQNEA
ncbi:MAG: cation-translocating P-type ATPase [Deltaproteobacteria bacterium]|nr:cation-translocating P-type ATPase [Deltaproteobacteria bacterium]